MQAEQCGGPPVARRSSDPHDGAAAKDAAAKLAASKEAVTVRPERGCPALSIRKSAGATKGVALVLHGGRSSSFQQVRNYHLSPARMVPFAWHLHRAGRDHGMAVWTLRNSVRGWNGDTASPLQDARWALARIHEAHPGVPVYLLGHSMGGLTALCAADDPLVDAVVAMAPWVSERTPAESVAGRKVLIVHGTTDRWTSPRESLSFARRAVAGADALHYVSLSHAGHFMFRRVRLWHALA